MTISNVSSVLFLSAFAVDQEVFVSDSSRDATVRITVTCLTCNERIDTRPKEVARKISCPFCGVKVYVPSLESVQANRAPEIAAQAADVGEYELTAPPEVAPVETHYAEVRAKVRREAPPPRPRWTFFSGVFTFPWRSDVILRWGFLSGGIMAVFLVAAIAIAVVGGITNPQGAVLAFFVLPEIWLSTWTFSYAAACCLVILEQTAAGVDRMETWPEPHWKEWVGHLIFVGWILVLTAVVGYGVGRSARLIWPDAGMDVPVLATMFTLFPICLLSALESGSWLAPLSGAILKSLLVLWWRWLLFYVLAALLAVAWIGSIWIGVRWTPFASLAAAPLLAAALLIYARLLGRMAGCLADMEPAEEGPSKKGKRKPRK